MNKLDASDLLKWASYLETIPKRTRPALARALNIFGDDAVNAMSQKLAHQTGLEAGAIKNLITVRHATPSSLKFEADASAVARTDPQWLRPWQERDQSTFEQDTLVKIITTGDEHDCEICTEMAENSPYTLREVKNMAEQWAHFHGSDSGPAGGARTNLIHPNAVLEGSRFISYGLVREMVSAKFCGPAVCLETKVGIVTIGPNHPMLTRRGFVPANQITESDELLYDTRSENSFAVSNVIPMALKSAGLHTNFKQVPFIEDVFASLSSVGMTKLTASSNDLHGDAVFCEDEIDVVRPARNLLQELEPCGIEKFSELGFPFPDVKLFVVSRLRPLHSLFETSLSTDYSLMSSQNLILAFAGTHTRPLDQFLFRSGSELDICKSEIDNLTTDVKSFGKCIYALSRFVKLNNFFRWDKVIGISVKHFKGLAFDASTDSALYNSDGYVVHNCRCTYQPWTSTRRMKMTFGSSGAPPELLTARQLGQRVAAELKIALRVKL